MGKNNQSETKNVSEFVILEEEEEVAGIGNVNVDDTGMVYLFDYEERDMMGEDVREIDEFQAQLQLIASISLSLVRMNSNQESYNSIRSNSGLPFGGRFRGGADSSVLMFDSNEWENESGCVYICLQIWLSMAAPFSDLGSMTWWEKGKGTISI